MLIGQVWSFVITDSPCSVTSSLPGSIWATALSSWDWSTVDHFFFEMTPTRIWIRCWPSVTYASKIALAHLLAYFICIAINGNTINERTGFCYVSSGAVIVGFDWVVVVVKETSNAWSLIACTGIFRLAICHFVFEPALTPVWCSSVPCVTYAVVISSAQFFACTVVITFKRDAPLNIIPLAIMIYSNTICFEVWWYFRWLFCHVCCCLNRILKSRWER